MEPSGYSLLPQAVPSGITTCAKLFSNEILLPTDGLKRSSFEFTVVDSFVQYTPAMPIFKLTLLLLLVGCGGTHSSTPDAGDASEDAQAIDGGTSNQGGIEDRSIIVDGIQRFFTVVTPAYENQTGPFPTILVLHGGGGQGHQLARDNTLQYSEYRNDALTDTPHDTPIIFVYPNADLDLTQYPETGDRYWNDHRPESQDGIDDVRFLSELRDQLITEGTSDQSRIILTGVSNGGMMTMRTACETTNLFAAFAPVIANLPVVVRDNALCTDALRVPMLFIHGTRDTVFMPYEGGTIFSGQNTGLGGDVISATDTVDVFRDSKQCITGTPTNMDRVDDGTQPTAHNYNCGGIAIRHIIILGAGHAPPSTLATGENPLPLRQSADFDWLDEVVFFSDLI